MVVARYMAWVVLIISFSEKGLQSHGLIQRRYQNGDDHKWSWV
jgi:hypothetical protein